MEEIRKLLEDIMGQELVQIILSNTRDADKGSKVKIRPVMIKGDLFFQETLYKGTQVFHKILNAGR